MITWMTRASFIDTANDLNPALAMQTAEAVLNMVDDMMTDGTADPAARGWIGAESALAAYGAAMAVSLVTRGFTMTDRVLRLERDFKEYQEVWEPFDGHPAWVHDADVIRSHRSNLVRRMPGYAKTFVGTKPNWPYLWPVMDGSGGYDLIVSKVDRARLKTGERRLPSEVKARITNL